MAPVLNNSDALQPITEVWRGLGAGWEADLVVRSSKCDSRLTEEL